MPSNNAELNRAAVKRHYDNNKEYYQAKNKLARERKAEFIRAARNVPCLDCKQEFPWYVMEFDHRVPEEKKYNVASMRSESWKAIHTEIAKCDVVCANCHSTRTHFRRNKSI